MPGSVVVDTGPLERAARKLARGLDQGGPVVARRQAAETAGRIASGVPRRTGRLAATVTVVPLPDGAGVAYGAGLPYAGYIERRAHAVEQGTEGAAAAFAAKARVLAATEVSTL